MIVGIECTAHTFGAGVVLDEKVLSNIRDMYTTSSGGIIPTESAEHHKKVAEDVWSQALEKAGVSEGDITGIAVSNAPGLAPCLHAGVNFAKAKAEELGVKLIGVNHCVAHLEIGRSVGAVDPVLLYASGANTQIIAYASGKYRVFGETLDIGVGNFIDKIGRHMGMGFPAGPSLEKEAVGGEYIELPYAIKGMDVSFSGMQTKIQQLYDSGVGVGDLAYSMQETAFAMLVEAAERALAHTGKKELVLGGGVACNARLQEMCKIMCAERGAKFFCPSQDLLVDNAAMIGYLGEIMFNKGIKDNVNEIDVTRSRDSSNLNNNESKNVIQIKPRERTDHVQVTWR